MKPQVIPSRPRFRTALLGSVLAAGLVLAGCSSPGGGDQGGENGSGEGGSTVEPAGPVGVATIDPEQVIVSQTYEKPGTEQSMTIDVLSLEVEEGGQLMTLRLALTPQDGDIGDSDEISGYEMESMVGVSNFEGAVKLIDRSNLKQYSVVRGDPGPMSTELYNIDGVNGETFIWWGTFAAPADEIGSLDLHISDDLPDFTDVPITW
ncbi:hypothetical protein [Brevibacterium litoralis]|uniref:hypothetical protein n=1 Tax=Brevibacterium litoralis TaxID=3138935 RepID=UPI0032EDC375